MPSLVEGSVSPPPKRALTAYFLFAAQVREEVKQSLEKQSVTAISKLIGEKWNSLSEEEKKIYQEKAQVSKQEYLKKMEEYKKKYPNFKDSRVFDFLMIIPIINLPFQNSKTANKPSNSDFAFPVSVVRRIVHLDSDVGALSKEALHLLVKSTVRNALPLIIASD